MKKDKPLPNPFTQKSSISYQIFEKARRGITIKQIVEFCIRKGSDKKGAARLVRILRSGNVKAKAKYPRQWNVQEKNGTLIVCK